MCFPTRHTHLSGCLAVLALLAAGCADQAPPLEPIAAGALLAGQGQGPQNPEVTVFEIEVDIELPGFCEGYPGYPDGFTIRRQVSGRVRAILLRHPVTGALRAIEAYQGLDVLVTANNKSASSNIAGPIFYRLDLDGIVSQEIEVGLTVALVAPGWGVILHEAGRLVYDPATDEIVFEAGPHQALHNEREQFCAYFTS
jgi:hypothetical protein